MKKTIIILACVSATILFIWSFSRNSMKEDTLRTIVRFENSKCPITMINGVGQISSMGLENGYVISRVDYKPGNVDLDLLESNLNLTREMFYYSIISTDIFYADTFLEEILKLNYGIKVIASDGHGRVLEIKLTSEYLSSMSKNAPKTKSEALRTALLLRLKLDRLSLPMEVGDGLTLIGLELENNSLVIITEISEEIYDIKKLKESISKMEQSSIDDAYSVNDELRGLIELCKNSNIGLIERMIGDTSKEYVDIVILE